MRIECQYVQNIILKKVIVMQNKTEATVTKMERIYTFIHLLTLDDLTVNKVLKY